MFLLQGTSRMTNQNGTQMINPGSDTYELNLQKQQNLVIGGLNIDLGLGQANVISIPEFNFKAEYTYHLRVQEGGRTPVITELQKSDISNPVIILLNE
jgi:hypothetical protein